MWRQFKWQCLGMSCRYLAFLWFIVLPFSCILIGKEGWIGRFVALCLVIPIGISFWIWYGMSPKTEFVKKGAKLDGPEYAKVKPRFVILARTFFLISGIGFLLYFGIPFARGLYYLASDGGPQMIKTRVVKSSSAFGLWFLGQSIKVENNKDGYFMMYSLRPRLRANSTYEFLLLPRSRFVLQAEEIKNPPPSQSE